MGMITRYIAVGLVMLGGYAAMTYMQERFDHADLRKAELAVRLAEPLGVGQPTLEQLLATKLQVDPTAIRWKTTLESKWRGTVLVTASLRASEQKAQWRVDLAVQQVAPANELAHSLVAEASP